MAKCFIQDTTLTAIGDAIRAKTGGTDLMLPSAMPDAIAEIGGGSGDYIWSIQHAGEDATIDRNGGTYTLTTSNDSRPSTEIEYSLAAARYNADTKKWEFEESTVVTLVNTDNVVPEMEATLMFVRLTSEPNIIYRINGFNVGTMTANNTYTKSMTIVQKKTYSLDSTDITYIADDDSMKYPDGGWLDGLYYTAFDVSSSISDFVQSNVTSGNYWSIHYDNGLWVAAGYSNNGLWYSTDGIAWTQSNVTSYNFKSVYYANGIWVAGSGDGNAADANGFYYSTDGMTWTQGNVTIENINRLCYGNGMWVAGSTANGLYYSTDGMTWTQSNITDGNFRALYYGNGLWVTGSGNNGLYYSTDGITWTQSNKTSGSFYFNAVYYGNGIWVAGEGTAGTGGLWYSLDGMTWTQSNKTIGTFYCVHYANGIWVAGLTGSGTGLWYSTDGMTWTQSNVTRGNFNSLYYANGLWVAAGGYNNGLYYSTDGITWTQSNITSNNFRVLHYANGIWVAPNVSSKGLYYSKITQRTLKLSIPEVNDSPRSFVVTKDIPEITDANGDASIPGYCLTGHAEIFPIIVNGKTYSDFTQLKADFSGIYCSTTDSAILTTDKTFVKKSNSNNEILVYYINPSDEPTTIPGFTLVITCVE